MRRHPRRRHRPRLRPPGGTDAWRHERRARIRWRTPKTPQPFWQTRRRWPASHRPMPRGRTQSAEKPPSPRAFASRTRSYDVARCGHVLWLARGEAGVVTYVSWGTPGYARLSASAANYPIEALGVPGFV